MKILPHLPISLGAWLLITTHISAAEEAPKPYQMRPVTIWSDGTRMAGDLDVPADLKEGGKRAAILFCAGTGGTKKNNGALYATRFVKEGFVVLAFDYRGWGESDGKLTGKMAAYAQMRVNPAKSIGYSPVEASEKIKAPTMILVAEKEELMNNDENGKKAFDILQSNKVPSEYHVLPGITHYGVYREAFTEATRLEAAWYAAHLMGRSSN